MKRSGPLILILVLVAGGVWWGGAWLLEFLGPGVEIGVIEEHEPEARSLERPPGSAVAAPEPDRPGEAVRTREAAAEEIRADPDATWVVRGMTKLAWRDPYPGRRVRVSLYEGYDAEGEPSQEAELTSDENGWFEWPLTVPATTVVVQAKGLEEGHRNSSDSALVVRGAEPPRSLEVRMYPQDCSLVGLVHDEQGEPIAGARVWTSGDETSSDESGAFRLLASSAREEAYVYARATGHAQARVIAQIAGPGTESSVRFELVRAFQVEGRAVDEHAQPLADVEVQTFFTHENVARTGADGHFVLDHLDPRRENHTVYARKDGYVEASTRVNPGQDVIEIPDLVMKKGIRVEGFVFGPDGDPLPGAELYIGFSPFAYNRLDAVARDDGAFVFPHVPTGSQTLFVGHAGYAPFQYHLNLPEDQPVQSGVIVRLVRGHFLGGIVRDGAGEVLSGVGISARQGGEYISVRTQSGEDGRFRVEGLPEMNVDLEFYGTGIVRKNVPVDTFDHEDLEVVLDRSAKVAGRVLDGVTGEPLQEFLIRFVRPDVEEGRGFGYAATWSREGHRFTDTDGYWDSGDENLPPGGVLGIEARAEGYAPARDGHVVAAVDPDSEGCVLRLYRGATLAGRVEDPDGRAVPGAKVAVRAASDPSRSFSDEPHDAGQTVTDEDGWFELPAVAPGEAVLLVRAADWPSFRDGPFEVPIQGRLERVVRLPRGATLTGVLQNNDGAVWAGESISIYGLELPEKVSFSRDLVTDEAGEFQAQGLPDGLYQISHGQREGSAGAQLLTVFVRVQANQGERVVLRAEGPCRLTGRLFLEDGSAYLDPIGVSLFSGLSSELPREQQPPGRGTIARDGSFEITDIQAGSYRLMSTNWGRGVQLSGSVEVDLTAGDHEVDITLKEYRSGR